MTDGKVELVQSAVLSIKMKRKNKGSFISASDADEPTINRSGCKRSELKCTNPRQCPPVSCVGPVIYKGAVSR